MIFVHKISREFIGPGLTALTIAWAFFYGGNYGPHGVKSMKPI